MTSTYGLGGAGLVGAGLQQKNEAMGLLGRVAEQETEREISNKRAEDQRRAGNQQLGATAGTMAGWAAGASYGSSAGPYGALIGGIVGALAGNLF
jgi:hypothetical protein